MSSGIWGGLVLRCVIAAFWVSSSSLSSSFQPSNLPSVDALRLPFKCNFRIEPLSDLGNDLDLVRGIDKSTTGKPGDDGRPSTHRSFDLDLDLDL